MVGLMANAARHEPPAVAALRAGRDDRMNRLLRLPLPEPYLPARAVRDRLPKPERTAVPARTAQKRKTVQKSQTAQKAKPSIKAKAATKTGKRAPGTVEVAGKRAKTVAKAGTARGSGHLGGASQQRRGGAAKAQTKQETGRSRRSRTLEGQRYG
jgi:cell division protein FtsW